MRSGVHYRYTVLNQPVRSPLWQRYAHHVVEPLDVSAMSEASRQLIGSSRFRRVRQADPGREHVREVMQAEWLVEGQRLIFEITANAFLYQMVRNVVGTLLRVGRG